MRLLARFISLELLIQGVNFIASILLVRFLSIPQYAFYTLANAMQSNLNIMADNGIGSGITAIGGRVYHDRYRFGQLINTALGLRRVLGIVAALVITPVLLYLLWRNDAPIPFSLLLAGAMLLGFFFHLSVGVLMPVPLIHLRVNPVQNLNFWSAIVRLALLLIAYLTVLNAVTAILAASLSFALQNVVLKRWAPRYIDTEAPPNAEDRREITAIIKRQAPNSLYYCVQGQIAVWLISIFGSTQSIAEIGALGRLAMVFGIASSILGHIVYPRFVRVQEPQVLWRRYWQILGIYTLFGASLVTVVGVFPREVLWLLGKQYAHLESEVLLMVLSSVLNAMVTTMYGLNASRAWILPAWIAIPAGIITQGTLIVLLDISTVSGVLWLQILSTFPGMLLNVGLTMRGIFRWKESAQSH